MNEKLRERLIAGYPWVSLPLEDLDNDDAWAAADVDFLLSEIAMAGFKLVSQETLHRVVLELQEVNHSCDGLMYLTKSDCEEIGWPWEEQA